MRMETYDIAELIPVERKPTLSTLRFYATLMRAGIDPNTVFDHHPAIVVSAGRKQYLWNGNQRAIIYHLNGITTIDAIAGSADDLIDCRTAEKENLAAGVRSIADLAGMLRNPERYIIRRDA